MKRKLAPSVLLAALVLAGCASVPDLPAQPPAPAQFRESAQQWIASRPAEAQSRGTWWKAFARPALGERVERAGAGNTTIQQAAGRLTQARAIARSVDADRMPQL